MREKWGEETYVCERESETVTIKNVYAPAVGISGQIRRDRKTESERDRE